MYVHRSDLRHVSLAVLSVWMWTSWPFFYAPCVCLCDWFWVFAFRLELQQLPLRSVPMRVRENNLYLRTNMCLYELPICVFTFKSGSVQMTQQTQINDHALMSPTVTPVSGGCWENMRLRRERERWTQQSKHYEYDCDAGKWPWVVLRVWLRCWEVTISCAASMITMLGTYGELWVGELRGLVHLLGLKRVE